jgi:ABC-type Mn2+/Zn2+ transport system ATPase subunit
MFVSSKKLSANNRDRTLPDIVVQATGVSVGYSRRMVLSDVSLQIKQGEFWFFIGPNGEGKSTLLKTLLGSHKPASGTVQWSRKDQTGFVPQRCDLNPALPTTVREFVSLGLVGLSVSQDEARQRLSEALEKVGLSGLLTKSYWSLSGGQRQRALVARALVRRPKLLIADEPTNGLDIAAEEALLRTLADLNRDGGVTIIFVTHNLAIALRYATHVALFYGGRVQTGPREEMLDTKRLKETYGVHIHWGDVPHIGEGT